ncbi:MAG: hypothetical protein ABL930_09885 [Pseudobdellovibrio sp.]
MPKESNEIKRQIKKDNGEVVEITEEEFQNVVSLFKLLSDWDKDLFFDAFNGVKLKMRMLKTEDAKKFVGKYVYIAIFVKEEVQTKSYDAYYKLEKVKLLASFKKGEELKIEGIDGKPIEIENRRVFVDV